MFKFLPNQKQPRKTNFYSPSICTMSPKKSKSFSEFFKKMKSKISTDNVCPRKNRFTVLLCCYSRKEDIRVVNEMDNLDSLLEFFELRQREISETAAVHFKYIDSYIGVGSVTQCRFKLDNCVRHIESK